MGLIELLILIAVVGFLVQALITSVPMPAQFKTAIIVLAVIVLIVFVLRALGIGDIPLRR